MAKEREIENLLPDIGDSAKDEPTSFDDITNNLDWFNPTFKTAEDKYQESKLKNQPRKNSPA